MIIHNTRHAIAVIRQLREAAGISRRELGELTHISLRTVHGREAGEQGMPLDAVIEAAAVFGLEVALVPRQPKTAAKTWRSAA